MMENLGGAAPPLALDDDGFVVATGPEGDHRAGGVVLGPMVAAFGVAAGLARAAAAPGRAATSTCRAPTRCWLPHGSTRSGC